MNRFRLYLLVIGIMIPTVSLPGISAAADFHALFETGFTAVPTQQIEGGTPNERLVPKRAGYNLGIAAGVHLYDHFIIEAALGFRRNEMDRIRVSGRRYDAIGHLGMITAMANAYVELAPADSRILPYFGLGAGLANYRLESRDSGNFLKTDDDSVEFAWNVMGGWRIKVTDIAFVRLGYRYFATSKSNLDATVFGTPNSSISTDYDAHEAVIGLGVSF